MGTFRITTFAIILAVVVTSKALKCYVCEYSDDDDLNMYNKDSSCKAGKKPKDKFSMDCSNVEYKKIDKGSFIVAPKNSIISANSPIPFIPNEDQATYSCVKLTVDGKIVGLGGKLKAAIRTCLKVTDKNEMLPDVCYEDENSKLQEEIKEDWLKTGIAEVQLVFTNDTKLGICSCSSDDCNGALNQVSVPGSVLFAATLMVFGGNFL